MDGSCRGLWQGNTGGGQEEEGIGPHLGGTLGCRTQVGRHRETRQGGSLSSSSGVCSGQTLFILL